MTAFAVVPDAWADRPPAERRFLMALYAHPVDAVARSAYADWLEAAGRGLEAVLHRLSWLAVEYADADRPCALVAPPPAWDGRAHAGWDGLLDRLVGGVGLRRGRRDPKHLMVGDAVDFWRVEELIPQKLLRLRAEMKMPGLAWLEFRLEANETGTKVTQIATYAPKGLLGHLYWWSVFPMHGIVFPSMLKSAAGLSRRSLKG